MANLSIRKLDDQIYQRLQSRALEHGISMEEEVRQILYHAVCTPKDISAIFQKYFSVQGIVLDLDNDHKRPHEPMDFNK